MLDVTPNAVDRLNYAQYVSLSVCLSLCPSVSQRRHCVLDVTPNAVDRLNYAQYVPLSVCLSVTVSVCLPEETLRAGRDA